MQAMSRRAGVAALGGLALALVCAATAAAVTPEASVALGLGRSARGLLGFQGEQRSTLLTMARVGLRVSRGVSLGIESTLDLSRVPTPSYAESSRAVFVLATVELREKYFYWRPGVGLVRLSYQPHAVHETAPALGLALGRELSQGGRWRVRLEALGRMRTAGGTDLRTTLVGAQVGVRW
jgi:hypothetical protein